MRLPSVTPARAGQHGGLVETPLAPGGLVLGHAHRLDGRRVLVVDDEPESRDLLAHVLQHAGAQVTTASPPWRPGRHWSRTHQVVLVSDIEMPGEDGSTR